MKKEISISLLALSLVACGGSSSSSNDSSSAPDPMNISSYASDAATDTSPVGTWVVILDGKHYTNDVQDWTYQQKEIFTIEEDGDNYIINSCDFYQLNSTVAKTNFLIEKTDNQTSQNSTSNYFQTFTSNLAVTGTSEYIENVAAYESEPASVEKWIESAKGIKVNDSIDIQENLSIDSQNSDLEKANIELNCFNIAKYSNGAIKLEINSIDNIEIFIESNANDSYLEYSNLNLYSSSNDTDVDFSVNETNNTLDNYSATAIYSDSSLSGTFNIGVDFK